LFNVFINLLLINDLDTFSGVDLMINYNKRAYV